VKTILYIEDNADNLKVLRLMINRLRPADEVIPSDTAERGLELANELQPDLILMDINLPRMNGYQALEILQNNVATSHIPVVAVTAYAMQENIRQGMAAGFAAYITKPVNMQELNHTLEMLLPVSNMAHIG